MHNAAFAALGLNWRYLAFEVDPKNLRAAIEGARAMGFAGINLTVPHKLLAVDMVDELDESAKIWGAVNTIQFEGRTAKATGFRCGNLNMKCQLKFAHAVSTRMRTQLCNRFARRFENGVARRKSFAAWRGRGWADGGVEACVRKESRIIS